MIKQWFTAQELADLVLPDMPETAFGVRKKADAEHWPSRPRKGRGGGREYNIAALPQAARLALVDRLVDAGRLEDLDADEQPQHISAADRKRDAKLIILKRLDELQNANGIGRVDARTIFATLYNEGSAAGIPGWVRDTVASVSERSLRRWDAAVKKQDVKRLGRGQNNRKGTGILDLAEGGRVKEYIEALVLAQPHLTAGRIRDMLRAEFGTELEYRGRHVALPKVRSITRFVSRFREENKREYLLHTNPDAYKSKYQLALGKADADVSRLNQHWEIDASPADVLCRDGRYNIYAVIDVWSRRVMFLVTRTPATVGSLALIRRAILEWGVPEVIKTDNGSDFVSGHFMTAIKGLGIEQVPCPRFTPEGKPHVERVFRTLQHDLMSFLPGFIGHNVSDRKAIESRKTFAKRLGEDDKDAFSVGLSHEELQDHLIAWTRDFYEHREHSSIGTTPFKRAASWKQPVYRIENERALDLMLAPLAGSNGIRTVTKKGLRIDGGVFWNGGLLPYIGKRVFVRHDPEDMGRVYCFDEDTGEFIDTAIDHNRLGVTREAASRASKAAQKRYDSELRKERNRIKRSLTPEKIAETLAGLAAQDVSGITAFPHRSDGHTSPELVEAGRATGQSGTDNTGLPPEMERYHEEVIKPRMTTPGPVAESEEQRNDRLYAKWCAIKEAIEADAPVPEDQIKWFEDVADDPQVEARRLRDERIERQKRG